MAGMRRWWLGAVLVLGAGLTAYRQAVPPEIGGVRLGFNPHQVRRSLGRPDREQESLGMRFWDYQRRGITVIWKEGEARVSGIVASRSAAGDIRGARVGDSEEDLRRQWGTPARVRQDGRFLDFVGANWVLSAEVVEQKVMQITLMAAGAAIR